MSEFTIEKVGANGEPIPVKPIVEKVPLPTEPVPTPDAHVPNTEVAHPETPAAVVPPVVEGELPEDKVLAYINKKSGKEFASIDDLFVTPEPEVIEKMMELPANVAAFNKYHTETGRSIEDFVKLNRDYGKMNPDQVLVDYYSHKHPEWTEQDVLAHVKDQFGYDPDLLGEEEIAAKERSKKTEVAKAVTEFNSLKEQYSAPLASRALELSDDEKEGYEAYKQQSKTAVEAAEKTRLANDHFTNKTLELFNDSFEGFEFNVGTDTPIVFKPDNHQKIADDQMNLSSYLNSFKGEDGLLKDAKEFHSAIYAAKNRDALAKFFYEKGKADQVVEFEKTSKNIDMSTHNTTQVVDKGTFKVEKVSSGGEQQFGIKSRKKT